MKKLSGGGIQSNKNVKVGVQTGGPNRAINSAYPSQLGAHFGNHSEKGDTGKTGAVKMEAGSALPSKLGNELATNVGQGGPGTGRTVYRSGYQALHGAAVQGSTPKPVDILNQYGSDSHPQRRIKE